MSVALPMAIGIPVSYVPDDGLPRPPALFYPMRHPATHSPARRLDWQAPPLGSDTRGAAAIFAEAVEIPTAIAISQRGDLSPERCSHSDVPLYISLGIIHTKYTGVRQNDCTVYA